MAEGPLTETLNYLRIQDPDSMTPLWYPGSLLFCRELLELLLEAGKVLDAVLRGRKKSFVTGVAMSLLKPPLDAS